MINMAFVAMALTADKSTMLASKHVKASKNTPASITIWLFPALMRYFFCIHKVSAPVPPTEALCLAKHKIPKPIMVPPNKAANMGCR